MVETIYYEYRESLKNRRNTDINSESEKAIRKEFNINYKKAKRNNFVFGLSVIVSVLITTMIYRWFIKLAVPISFYYLDIDVR